MSHINNPSSSIDSNEAALLTSLEGLASGTGQAIVKSGSTTLGLVTFGDLTKSQADTYYYPLSTNPAGYLTDAPSDGSTYGRKNGAWAVASAASPLTLTDGVHTITGTTQITVTGGTVGGTTPNATLTITGGSGASTADPFITTTTAADLSNYTNLGSLGSGFVKSTVALGVSTISIDSNTYLTSVTAHNLLSTTHGDTTADTVVRGDIITGQGATPKWARLAFPSTPTGKVLIATATDVAWSASALGTAAYAATGDFVAYRTFGTAANNNTGDFLAYNGTAVAVSGLTITAGASISGSNTGDNTVATALSAQYIDWNSVSGGSSIANKPTIPSVGSWGALNYPTWASGTPFVKMTAAGTFALDTNTYLTSLSGALLASGATTGAVSQTQIFTNTLQITALTASKVVFTDSSKNLTSTGIGTSSQFIKGDGSLDSSTYLTSVTAHNILSTTHGDTLADSVVAGDILIGNATPKWSRLAVGTDGYVLTIDSGTHLPSWKVASGGFTNPMTTLGDIIFENATPAADRLAGNTTTTKKYLQSVRVGGVATAPSWQQVDYSDISNTPSLSGYLTGITADAPLSGAGTSASHLVVATVATGTSGVVAASGTPATNVYLRAAITTGATSWQQIAYADISGTPSIPAAQIQSDWNQTNNALLDYIKNKPTIPSVGTWGALNYPTWASGTPFVKMTAAGIFALDTNTYLTSLSGAWLLNGNTNGVKKTLGSIDNYDIGFLTNNTERMTILANGNVGIGTTNPTLLLDLNGATGLPPTSGSTETGSLRLRSAGGDYSLDMGMDNGTGVGWIQGTNKENLAPVFARSLALNPNGGNVGIGNTSPGGKLQITVPNTEDWPTLGTAAGSLRIAGSTNLWGMYAGLKDSTGGGWLQVMRGDGATAYNLALQPVGGNVGIGTTAPGSKLSVVGLPTSASGLSSGDIWVDTTGGLNILKIV